jgi:hypothetical protein
MVRRCCCSETTVEVEMVPAMTEEERGERCVIRCGGEVRDRAGGKAVLMLQFVSHLVQQPRHAKGLLEGPPCPEEFRNIQHIVFPSYA